MPLDWITRIMHQGAMTVGSFDVLLTILSAIVVTAALTALGVWVTRRVGLLARGAPASDCLGNGQAFRP